MEPHSQHCQYIFEAVSPCSGLARVLFGLLATERLRGCCWVSQAGGGVWPLFASVLQSAFTATIHGNLSPELCAQWKVQLEDEMPEEGEALDTQAQSAFICLIGSLDLLTESSIEDTNLVVNALVDALDNYVYFIHNKLMAAGSDGPDDYALIEREYSRQLEDAAFAGAFGALAREQIVERRLENFQFAIPAAVGA